MYDDLTFFLFVREDDSVGRRLGLASLGFLASLCVLLRGGTQAGARRLKSCCRPCASGNRIYANHLGFPRFYRERQLAKSNGQRLLLAVYLHRLAVLRRIFTFIYAFIDGQGKLGAVP